jgi:hypothetical protein|tara:strand:+ start:1174 stop:2157 length:984 start_codon:yes stop_codon:yes gene_type:complete
MATGWGRKTWGASDWGDLSNETVSLSGISLTSSIGSSVGRAGADAGTISGIQLTLTNAGAVAGSSVDVSVTGSLESLGVGTVTTPIGQEINVTGSQSSTSIGSVTIDDTTLTGEGWGRGSWGEFAWGDNFSVLATGISLTASIGNAIGFTDHTVEVTGQQLTSTFSNPSFSIQIDGDVTVLAAEDQLDALTTASTVTADANVDVTGIQITGSIGTAVGGLKTPVDVSGIQASMTLGTFTLIQTTVESPTGIQATMSLGQHADIPGQIIGVSGLQATSSIGSVTVTANGLTNVDGIQATLSAGSTNVTAWSEINPGVNNSWTEVDRAA